MKNDILARIAQKMDHLSKGQKRIALLICERTDEACFMTAAQIGKNAGVSESTVVRFACELGYKGFPELQKDLQRIALSRIGAAQHIQREQEDRDHKIHLWLNKTTDNIQKTLQLLDLTSFENAVARIKTCKTVYLASDEYSRGLLHYLKYHLSVIRDGVLIADSPLEWVRICPQDGLVFLGFGDGGSSAQALSHARSNGAYIIGFTKSVLTSAASFCDDVFSAATEGYGAISSLSAPMFLLQAFLESLLEGNEEQYCHTMDQLKDYQTKELKL